MSLLRRLFGGGVSRQVELNVSYFRRIRDDAVLEVVGEAYRQELVRQARPPGPDDLPPGLPAPPPGLYKALLVPEPGNEYDPNAIMVSLWAGGRWAKAGYLSRASALRYQPLFRQLAANADKSTPAVVCDAALTREGGGIGVLLHLGTPGECAVELGTDDHAPAEHPWVGRRIVFTGQGATTIHGVPLDREGQIMLARWAGCEVQPRLTKKTDALIVADALTLTGNLEKARDYSIPTVDEEEFVTTVGVPRELVARVTNRWAQS